MFSGNSIQDQMLKTYIDSIFNKYDKDKSGTLDENQLILFFNDLFKSLNINVQVNRDQTMEAIRSIDQNYDGQIDKKQLFDAFKLIMARSQASQLQNQASSQQIPYQPNIYQPNSYPYQPNPYQSPYQQYPQNNNYYYPPNYPNVYGGYPTNQYQAQYGYPPPQYGNGYQAQSYGYQTNIQGQYNPYSQGAPNSGYMGNSYTNRYGYGSLNNRPPNT